VTAGFPADPIPIMTTRRSFLRTAGSATALTALGDFGFLAGLPAVHGAEARLAPDAVRLDDSIEPLVRLLEDTSRDRVLEVVAGRLRHGVSYREVLAALLLAGVRNIQPRPVGFKFHAVLVVNSAHLASLASADRDRWLPIFWAIDQFKSSQAADVEQGDWTMSPVDEAKVPPSHGARQAFIDAMDSWDEAAADAAIVGLARTASSDELFELFCRYGVRDFRDIGHKAIYVANSFRTLEVIGWQHAEPVLRSLAYALLDRGGADVNPSQSDLPADRPFRHNLEKHRELRSDWQGGERRFDATTAMLKALRTASPDEASAEAIRLINHGASPESVFDALFAGAGELLMRAPGIRSLHAVTLTNAAHYAWKRCADEQTRKLLLLQNAAFLPLFRGDPPADGVRIDEFEPASLEGSAEAGVEEIFADVSEDRLRASRKMLAWLAEHRDPTPLADAARRLIFLKGTNSHDYKFSSAILEDHVHLGSRWRDRFLASSVFNLRGSAAADNRLVERTRAALES
jgi:hypothetical protein